MGCHEENSLLFFAGFESQFSDLLLQLLTMESHLLGCPGDVTLVAAQGTADEVTLESLNYLLFCLFESEGVRNIRNTTLLTKAQVSSLDLCSGRENCCCFNYILE